ncbi:MAG: hypothetical protein K8T91_19835 [Planctomycetes bacterium]|nr:hypothetical protein [Planctomycetota bacterium]
MLQINERVKKARSRSNGAVPFAMLRDFCLPRDVIGGRHPESPYRSLYHHPASSSGNHANHEQDDRDFGLLKVHDAINKSHDSTEQYRADSPDHISILKGQHDDPDPANQTTDGGNPSKTVSHNNIPL